MSVQVSYLLCVFFMLSLQMLLTWVLYFKSVCFFFCFLNFVLFCLTSAIWSFCCYMLLLVWCVICVSVYVNQFVHGFHYNCWGSYWFLLFVFCFFFFVLFCSFIYSFVWFFLLHFVFVLCTHQWKKWLYFCDFCLLFPLCVRSTLISVSLLSL